jgi:hypothetical protein
VNAVIAGYLIYSIFRNPVPETGRKLYRLSITFPYIAGTVAGVQLVAAMFIGLYP